MAEGALHLAFTIPGGFRAPSFHHDQSVDDDDHGFADHYVDHVYHLHFQYGHIDDARRSGRMRRCGLRRGSRHHRRAAAAAPRSGSIRARRRTVTSTAAGR
jgi:hypothetical protein